MALHSQLISSALFILDLDQPQITNSIPRPTPDLSKHPSWAHCDVFGARYGCYSTPMDVDGESVAPTEVWTQMVALLFRYSMF